MDKLVFKDWLLERGLLGKWVAAYLSRDDSLWRYDAGAPGLWVSKAVGWSATEDGNKFWWERDQEWKTAVCDHGDPVISGLPMEDDLALSLICAEEEQLDGD